MNKRTCYNADEAAASRTVDRMSRYLLFFARSLLSLLFVCPAFAETASWTGTVLATSGPNNPVETPMHVHKRDLVSVSVSGQIRLGEAPPSGPAGSYYYDYDESSSRPPFGYTHGIIMIRINGNHFPIEGGARTFECPAHGDIYTYVNDDVNTDNSGAFAVTISVAQAIVDDADEDGLSDAVEDSLLDQYAPRIQFDLEEFVAPADVYWYLRNCDLLESGDEQSRRILDRRQVPFYPEWFINQYGADGRYTNYLYVRDFVPSYCNIRNSHRYGPTWDRVIAAENLGVYGHVVPRGDVVIIQYWLFYGWNSIDAPLNAGDHEGEWELYEVTIDAANLFGTSASGVLKAAWYAHGGTPTTWSRSDGWDTSPNSNLLLSLPGMPTYHAPIFVERGSHGCWPTQVVPLEFYSYAVGRNNGQGISYVPKNIPNVGEVQRPRLGTEIITQFNGLWGAFYRWNRGPEGPMRQSTWKDPIKLANGPAQYVGRWKADPIRNGHISSPWSDVGSAVKNASPGQSVLIFPGDYGFTGQISNAVVIKAPHGSVTIGR